MTIKYIITVFILFCGWFTQAQIIPKPVKETLGKDSFTIDNQTVLVFDRNDKKMVALANYFAERIDEISGIKLGGTASAEAKKIIFTKIADENIGNEGYFLSVNPQRIEIRYNAKEGAFYGVQSLLQLLPMARTNAKLTVQSREIEDFPRFAWRGMMLDVSRHFQTVESIKQTLDMLAFYKINTFQWHLCDNEGWRLEIQKYPELTEVGAWRQEIPKARIYQKDTIPQGEKYTYGGYYTQAQALDIVEYARERNITVIPEIEMPGHSGAALAAYPQYSCRGNAQETPNSILHHTDEYRNSFNLEYCAGNDEVFTFLEAILAEVFDIFPSEYIHIGGDEVDKSHWKACKKCQKRIKKEKLADEDELQSYFIKRMEKFINANGRKLLG
ncbi:MAG: beta-N-acetylhexosaminidase, partial [Capnocytophaga sp.]|nr:beta-N-acetylhexosaminidase [Capnocytophaga sp.]